MRLELRRTTVMGESEGLGVDGPAPDKDGQATSGPAASVKSRIHIDDEELAQIKSS
jgi:hypothetical protein